MTSKSNDADNKITGLESILLTETDENGILRLTLNDAKRRNALSDEMMAALSQSLDEAAVNKSVRVIVLAANGPAFCAGHDFKQIKAGRLAEDKGLAYFTKVNYITYI